MGEDSEGDFKSWKHSKTLSTSIQDDERRHQVDAAKKRAAAQHVDYPTFAALVSVAHLQPVDKKSLRLPVEGDAGKKVPAWSFNSSGNLMKLDKKPEVSKQERASVSKQEVLQSLADLKGVETRKERQDFANAAGSRNGISVTGDAFQRSWNSLSQESAARRLEFLSKTPPSALPTIFRVEIPPGILLGILQTLLDAIAVEVSAERAAVEVLDSLTKCPRFAISMKLIEKEVRSLVDQLFERLQRCSDIELLRLRSSFS